MNTDAAKDAEAATSLGVVEWFRLGDHEKVEEALDAMRTMGVRRLRTHLSWAEYFRPEGPEWFDWLLPRLGAEVELLPCVHYTPPSLSRTGRSSGPPVDLKSYADFIDMILTRHGQHFRHVEIWNEPNNLLDWDWRVDSDHALFAELAGMAAHWVGERGWIPVLGGPAPFDPVWLDQMGERGLLAKVAAIGLHGFPGTWDSEAAGWTGWPDLISQSRDILERHGTEAEIWITEAGYSTWRNDEAEQGRHLLSALDAGADRLYWYGLRDLPDDVAVQEGLWFDPRHYHMGLHDASGRPKLAARLLARGGPEKLREVTRLPAPALARDARPLVVTGGCGFIGSNLADAVLADGGEVIALDSLARPGVEDNLAWLRQRHPSRFHPVLADLRDAREVEAVLQDAGAVVHLAAQTAVTTSLTDPLTDFETNARGTLNVLEALRRTGRKVPLVFASTNKVYGAMDDLAMTTVDDRHVPGDPQLRAHGAGEDRPLDFHTPYGCSKGVADQYVLDYARSFGVPAAVLRMSCIYGPRQFGTEDQGWVAHFLIRALAGEDITIFGDGRQVRDILWAADAVAAYRLLLDRIDGVAGRAFNLGGGPQNAVSLRQVLDEIRRITGRDVDVAHMDWRQGDQPWFVADTRALTTATGWRSRTDWRQGLRRLADWLRAERPGTDVASLELPAQRASA